MDPWALKQKQNEGYVVPLYLLTETNVKYLHETCKLFSLLNADIISSKRCTNMAIKCLLLLTFTDKCDKKLHMKTFISLDCATLQ